VGAGRVGRALGRGLHTTGWRVGVVVTSSITSARAAVRAIGAGSPACHATHHLLDSDVVLISTPDDAVAKLGAELAHIGGAEWGRKVVLHTSGALNGSVLEPLSKAGAAIGSVHPMQTFIGQNSPPLAGCIFGIEGAPAAARVATKMCRDLGGVAVQLRAKGKATYHMAGLFACSHVLALMEAGVQLLMTQGFTRRRAIRALLPLTRQTLDNFDRVGARAAWTGPLVRGDFSTVKRHVVALAKFPREYRDAYNTLSRLAALVLSANPDETLNLLNRALGQHGGIKQHGQA